jgi:hypothetical protein
MIRARIIALVLGFVLQAKTTPVTANAQGWYMLYPPFTRESGGVDANAPIPSWIQGSAFDSAVDCERARQQFAQDLRADTPDKIAELARRRAMFDVLNAPNIPDRERMLGKLETHYRRRLEEGAKARTEKAAVESMLGAVCISAADPRSRAEAAMTDSGWTLTAIKEIGASTVGWVAMIAFCALSLTPWRLLLCRAGASGVVVRPRPATAMRATSCPTRSGTVTMFCPLASSVSRAITTSAVTSILRC